MLDPNCLQLDTGIRIENHAVRELIRIPLVGFLRLWRARSKTVLEISMSGKQRARFHPPMLHMLGNAAAEPSLTRARKGREVEKRELYDL
jgi:hypothetical protein